MSEPTTLQEMFATNTDLNGSPQPSQDSIRVTASLLSLSLIQAVVGLGDEMAGEVQLVARAVEVGERAPGLCLTDL